MDPEQKRTNDELYLSLLYRGLGEAVQYGPKLEIRDFKCTSLCLLGTDLMAIDDQNNTAGIYRVPSLNKIEGVTSKEESNQQYLVSGHAHKAIIYLSYSSGNFLTC